MKSIHSLLIAIALNLISVYAYSKNTVLVHGIEESEEIRRQAEFYAEYLGIEGTTILICFSYQMPEDVEGYTCYEKNELSQTILIKINKKLTISAKELILAHEMIHARQFVKAELVQHGHLHFSWKGEEFKNIREKSYADRGWEKEAFDLERTLLKLYKNQKSSA